ncbi:MAG TPA: metallophosphoesterase family protein [Trueperaceae bacterium]|nr:metallophosphoesterase family protein [Trueperaceae bacterium]
MRYLVLSDVHANAPALEAVLRHADFRGYDEVIFLGDAVGYYPDAEKVVATLRSLDPKVAIMGNHDAALLELAEGRGGGHREEGLVTEILARQLPELSDDSLQFLRDLEEHVVGHGWEAAHGALRAPFEYLATIANAQANLPLLEQQMCLVGHTHVPKIFAAVEGPGDVLWRTVQFRRERALYRIPPKARLFANPGSVGQPRDGIPLSAYALFDDEAGTLELFRVEFDVAAVQQSVRAAGYPEVLASRLAVGR